jgi:predicted nucleic acid-binding protein
MRLYLDANPIIYNGFFSRGGLELVDVSGDVIEQATELRAKHNFRAPDAVHLATALLVRADVFLTGDRNLERCPDLDVQVLTGPRTAP